MKTRKQWAAMVAAIVFAVGFSFTTAKAQDENWNQKTEITFSQPVEVPGQTLSAGTYWFELADGNPGVRTDQILIYNADRTDLVASVPSASFMRRPMPGKEIGHLTVTLTQPSANHPAALLSWAFPAESEGHQFYYSSAERHRLAEQQQFTAQADPVSSHGVILSASLR